MTQNVSAEHRLLSTAEASRISGLGRQYIERLLRQGRLAGIKPGHDWLIYEVSLHAFLAHPRKRGPKGPRKTSSPELLTHPSVDTASSPLQKKRAENGKTIPDDDSQSVP